MLICLYAYMLMLMLISSCEPGFRQLQRKPARAGKATAMKNAVTHPFVHIHQDKKIASVNGPFIGCIRKGNPTLACYLIMHYMLRLTIYVFHTNKDQAFSCRIIPFLYYCDQRYCQIRCVLKMPAEIAFFHRWELHVKLLSEYRIFLIWDLNLSRLDQGWRNACASIKVW